MFMGIQLYSIVALTASNVLCWGHTMTAEEKKTIYSLLKTASDAVYGYPSPDFPVKMPAFSDDIQHCSTDSDEQRTAADQPPGGGVSIGEIAEKVAACRRCQLYRTRTHTVPGEGVPHPLVLVIGEGPGADEDMSGRPFVGPAGQLLDKMLAAISLDRHTNCFIANIVKCRPPHNRDPEPGEAEACRSFLEAQIHLLKPVMILALGRIAVQNLLKTDTGIGKLRGTFHAYNGIPLLATYHPSALLRNVDLKRPAWEDLKLFRTRLEQLVPHYSAHRDR
jgi:DNA polymerase